MSGQSYIGSKISLISSSDIRYVGILHNINSFDSTVALQNVTSFGTEGRKQDPREEILGSDTVFDYVVFRGSDIKDLQVFEAPPTFQNPYPPYYQHMNMPVPENYRVAPQHVVQEKVAVAEPVDEALVDSLIKEVSDLDIQMAPSSKEIGMTSNIKREEKKKQVETIGRRDENTRKRDENNYKRKEETTRKREEKKHGETTRKIKDNGVKKDHRKNGKKEDAFRRGDSHNRGDTTAKRQESFKRDDSTRHQDSFKKDRRSSHRRPSGFVVPKSDFDFASSNAKFDKNDIQQQTETTQEPDHFYDKKKSFFDDISCEHKAQGTSRSYKEESKLNLETFGQANIRHRSRHRGRSSHNNTKLKSF